MLEQNLNFRTEKEFLCGFGVVQRLNAQPIARDEQGLTPAIPNGKGEHATQALDALFSILLIKVKDGFGVAFGAVGVAGGDELLAQRGMVVDFAIEHDPERVVFITERLMASREIDDAQAPHANPGTAFRVDAFIVRAAMRHYGAHAAQKSSVRCRFSAKPYDSRDSTHSNAPFLASRSRPGPLVSIAARARTSLGARLCHSGPTPIDRAHPLLGQGSRLDGPEKCLPP